MLRYSKNKLGDDSWLKCRTPSATQTKVKYCPRLILCNRLVEKMTKNAGRQRGLSKTHQRASSEKLIGQWRSQVYKIGAPSIVGPTDELGLVRLEGSVEHPWLPEVVWRGYNPERLWG